MVVRMSLLFVGLSLITSQGLAAAAVIPIQCGELATLTKLDLTKKSDESLALIEGLKAKVVGQDEAIQAVAERIQIARGGMNAPGRPLGNILFYGPTGVGKTKVPEALAEFLYGNPKALLKVDGAEFQQSHNIAKLIGSPPGYLGHGETVPLITQKSLDAHHTETTKISILLFDEIEKANESLWQLLLGMLDKGVITLGDNTQVDLSNTLIFMTSNVGVEEMNKVVNKIGFNTQGEQGSSEALEKIKDKNQAVGSGALARKFPPEFLNRLDKKVLFNPLGTAQIEQILNIELENVRQRALANHRFMITLTPAMKRKLIKDGFSQEYGARELKRVIDQLLVYNLATLASSGQIKKDDVIIVDFDGKDVVFSSRPAPVTVQGAADETDSNRIILTDLPEGIPAIHPAELPPAAPDGTLNLPFGSP